MARIRYYDSTTQEWVFADLAVQAPLVEGTALGDTLLWDGTDWITRPGLPAKLPALYQEIEYIQSTGTQYIQLDFPLSGDSKIVLDCEDVVWPSSGQNEVALIYETNKFKLLANNPGVNVLSWYYDQNAYYAPVSTTNRLLINVDRNYFYVNGNLVYSFDESSSQSTDNVCLFGKQSGAGILRASMKLRSAKFYSDGELVSDLVPCFRVTDGAIGLYDVVQDEFFANEGTGEFIAGAQVLSGLTDEQLMSTCSIVSDFVTIGGNLMGIDTETAIIF